MKFILTVTDLPDGNVDVSYGFDPPISGSRPEIVQSGAAAFASYIMKALNKFSEFAEDEAEDEDDF